MPHPRVGGIKRWCSSDICLCDVWSLSRTSGLSREKRGQGRLTLAHFTRLGHHFQGQKVKGHLVGDGGICGGLPHSLLILLYSVFVLILLHDYRLHDSAALLQRRRQFSVGNRNFESCEIEILEQTVASSSSSRLITKTRVTFVCLRLYCSV